MALEYGIQQLDVCVYIKFYGTSIVLQIQTDEEPKKSYKLVVDNSPVSLTIITYFPLVLEPW